MPQYRYTAYDAKGRKCRGKKEFSNEKEFRKFLKGKRMILIQFEILKKNRKMLRRDILSFTRGSRSVPGTRTWTGLRNSLPECSGRTRLCRNWKPEIPHWKHVWKR